MKVVTGKKTSDGAGVKLVRSLGTAQLSVLDPFLLLDEFHSDDPNDYMAGFPSHPHRGFETVTYMLAGLMEHIDSHGHKGILKGGGVQWMTAGRGIVHSEFPKQKDGLLRGFQLWVNLPASEKMREPSVPKIIADERERSGMIGELHALGAEVEVKTLPMADFLASDTVAIERKTRTDFESSIMDGRLFSQAGALVEGYARVILIVEGGQEYETRISRAALLGAYSSRVTDFGISLFFTRSMGATAELVFAIAKHEQLARKTPASVYAKRKALTLASQQRAIIESLPNVGPTLARKLLDYFYTVENVITAPESELREIDKMGEKKAKDLRKALTQRYRTEEDP